MIFDSSTFSYAATLEATIEETTSSTFLMSGSALSPPSLYVFLTAASEAVCPSQLSGMKDDGA